MPRQLFWFMLVGALSTVLQTIVYVSVREVLAATWASWLALLVVTPANTEAHRRVTFNVTTNAIGRLHGEAGLTSVVVYLANLAVAPWFAGIAGPHPSSLTESLILALTGSLVGGVRYVILRSWVFAARRHTPQTPAPADEATPAITAPPARLTRHTRRNTLRGQSLRFRPNAAPVTAGPTPATHAGLTTNAPTITAAGATNAATITAAGATTNAATITTAGPAANAATITAGSPAANAATITTATPSTIATGRSNAVAATGSSTSATAGVADRDVTGDRATGLTNGLKAATTFPAYPSTGNLTAALACLGTFAPIPTAGLCTGQANTGVLNQRPAGRLRTWHRNRRQHLTARS